MIDGGRNALLGFLYQFIGTASLQVRDIAGTPTSASAVAVRARKGHVQTEEYGQDATIRSDATHGEVEALQFKYSAAELEVTLAEFREILAKFDASRIVALAGGETITQFALIANRRLANGAHDVWVQRNGAQPPRGLLLRKAGRRWSKQSKKLLEPYGGDALAASSAWFEILRRLEIPAPRNPESDLRDLRLFASQCGVLEHEWMPALRRLIGSLLADTAQGVSTELTPDWLRSHLVGDAKAASLVYPPRDPPHIAVACQTKLQRDIQRDHLLPPNRYLHRAVAKELAQSLLQYPLVFVYGQGGCGKSLLVLRSLESVANAQLVWSEPARAVASESGIARSLNRARLPNLAGGGEVSLMDIRARLDEANRGRHVSCTIFLDGLDEVPRSQRPELSRIMETCRAAEGSGGWPITIVVTVRSSIAAEAPKHLMQEWLYTIQPDLVSNVGFVAVGDFADDELAEAAGLSDAAPEMNLANTLGGPHPGNPFLYSVPEDTIAALRHPVVWGQYLSLGEAERAGILEGQAAPKAHLARLLLGRFALRAGLRNEWQQAETIRPALVKVAQELRTAQAYSARDWNQACAGLLGHQEAEVLRREASTYGLVHADSGDRWRWGHSFVVEYLRELDAKEGA